MWRICKTYQNQQLKKGENSHFIGFICIIIAGESAMELRKFVAPEIIFGENARSFLTVALEQYGGKKPLFVTDAGLILNNWPDLLIKDLQKKGIEPIVFSDVSPNPRENEVMAGWEVFKTSHCDCVIALGGGSVIDCAKGIAIIATNGGHILDYEGIDRINNPVPPMICLPTTAGSAADISQFAIINDTLRRTKIAIISKSIVPDIALVDPLLLTTMSNYLTACTAIDALVHAVEAFVSNASSTLSDIHALEAIRLVSSNIHNCIKEPKNLKYRSKIMMGSLQAGLAFSNASLGTVHAMAHSLGGFSDLPHGECNAILLRHIINFNYPVVPDRFKEIAKAMNLDIRGMTTKTVNEAIFNYITNLLIDLGIERELGKRGISIQDIPNLAQRGIEDPCLLTNPRKTNQNDIKRLYEEAY